MSEEGLGPVFTECFGIDEEKAMMDMMAAMMGDGSGFGSYEMGSFDYGSYGGWGSAIIAVVHREYAARAKAEKASGGSGWESQRWYQDLLERASVSIARSNYEMLRNNRSLPRA